MDTSDSGYQNVFCDETFKGFVFACISDDPALTATIRAANDVIRSGLRQRFTALGKNELNTFMKENKTADLCKDGLAAGNDINVGLLASIMKLRIMNIRAERSGLKPDQARPDSQPGGDTAAKKPAKTGGAKAAEDELGGEDSKRKSKLRDKLPVKSETKVPTIDDEPVNGPEAYLGIFDMITPDTLVAMCEEGVFVDVVINVKTNLFNGETSQVKRIIERSWQSKSPLSRVIFKELTLAENLTGNELFDILSKVCYDTLGQREQHVQFYQNTAIVEIPIPKSLPDLTVSASYRLATESVNSTDVERLFSAILSESLNETSHETANAPTAATGPIVAVNNRTTVQTPNESPAQRNELLTALNLYFENAASRLSFYRTAGERYKETVGDLEDSTPIIPYGDVNAERSLLDKKSALNQSMTDILWFSRLHKALKDKIGNQQMKKSLLRKSQIQLMSGKPVALIDQALLQFEFEKIAKESLDNYHWIEPMDKDTLRQVIDKARTVLPHVVQHFYAHENMILLMLSASPPKKASIDYQKTFTFETMLPLGQYVAILSAKSELNLKKTPYIYKTSGPTEFTSSWKNIFYDGVNFRFYRQPVDNMFVNSGSFYFNQCKRGLAGVVPEHDIQLFVQPGDEAVLTIKTADNNSVKVYRNGYIQLVTDLPQSAAFTQASPKQEKFRIITPDGKIITQSLGGVTEVYFPTGNVFEYSALQKSWVLTKEDGQRIQLDEKRNVTGLASLKVGVENYPLEMRSVFIREDLVAIDKHVEKNNISVQQRDQTVYEYSAESAQPQNLTVKSKKWFPEVVIDREKSTVVLKWAQGHQLTVDRKRSEAQTVGFDLSSNVHIKVTKDGKMVAVGERTPDGFRNRLVFDIQKTVCTYTDVNGRSFEAAPGGITNIPEEYSRETSLGPISEEASVESVIKASQNAKHHFIPRTVRFFALSPDGNGLELLRESDVTPYLIEAKRQEQNVRLFEEQIQDVPGTLLVQAFETRRATGDGKYLIRRTMYRRDRLTEDLRRQISQDYSKVEKMQFSGSEEPARNLSDQSLFFIKPKQPKLQDDSAVNLPSIATKATAVPMKTVGPADARKSFPPATAEKKASANAPQQLHIPASVSQAIKRNKELGSSHSYFATSEGKSFLEQPQNEQRAASRERKLAAARIKAAESDDDDDSPPKIDLINLGKTEKIPEQVDNLQINNDRLPQANPIAWPQDHFNRANRQRLADFCFAELSPTIVKFGGNETKQSVSLKNLGTSPLRFKVESNKDLLAVLYEHGPIAPGMSRVLEVVRKSTELSALTGQKIVIKTEWETINLKISTQ